MAIKGQIPEPFVGMSIAELLMGSTSEAEIRTMHVGEMLNRRIRRREQF